MILFLGLAIYLGVFLVRAVRNPLVTTPAIQVWAEEGVAATGLVVRHEQVIAVGQPFVASLAREGERVGVGQAYLLAYATAAERDREARRRTLEQERQQLQEQLEQGDDLAHRAFAETEIRQQIGDLSFAVRRGNLDGLSARVSALRALALSGDMPALAARLAAVDSELAALYPPAVAATAIYADTAGMFSSRVDGLEHITPAAIRQMSPTQLADIIYAPRNTDSGGAVGKLITDVAWYYAALLTEYDAARLEAHLAAPGNHSVTVIFSGPAAISVQMQLVSLGEYAENARRTAIFRATTELVDTLPLRRHDAHIVYGAFTGIRVPQEAMRREMPDAETGHVPTYVFTLSVGRAERKFVSILYTGADYYLVTPDNSRTRPEAAFRYGNTIIVRYHELYHGRVVRNR